MSGIQIWLQKSNSDKFQFPVNPEAVGIQKQYAWSTVSLTTLGEYIVGGTKGLDTLTLSSFFPIFYNAGYCEYVNIPDPQSLADRLDRWAKDRSVLKLTILGEYKYKANVVITNYTTQAQGGHKGDILFELSLTEHYAPQLNKTKTKKVVTKPPSPNKKNTSGDWVYTVKKGDNLWNICKKYYNNGSRCWDLAKKNNIKNANLIFPNQKLRMWPR